jgi:hypothetical protein
MSAAPKRKPTAELLPAGKRRGRTLSNGSESSFSSDASFTSEFDTSPSATPASRRVPAAKTQAAVQTAAESSAPPPPPTGGTAGANTLRHVNDFADYCLTHYDEIDKLKEAIELKTEKKRAIHENLVRAGVEAGCYQDPQKKKNLQFDSGGEYPTRLVYDYYHNYRKLTLEMLDELASDCFTEDEWDSIMAVPGTKSKVDLIVTPIRNKQRYSKPTLKVMPCKQKKLQRTVPRSSDAALQNDVEVYAKLQTDIAAARARLKEIESRPEYVQRVVAAKQEMHDKGLHAQNFFEDVVETDASGKQVVVGQEEYVATLEEHTRPKPLSAKRLRQHVEALLNDKTATVNYATFRTRLMQAIEEGVEYSSTSRLTFAIRLPDTMSGDGGGGGGDGGGGGMDS